MIVDASLVVDYLLDGGARGSWSAAQIAAAESLHAPHVFDLEVISGARQAVLRGFVAQRRAEEAVERLGDLRVTRYPVVHLLGRIWELRKTLTPYDAAYVALAEALALPVVTTDLRLGRAHGHRAEVVAFDG